MNDLEVEMIETMNQKLLVAYRAINVASTFAELAAANAEYKRVYAMIRALTVSLEGEAE